MVAARVRKKPFAAKLRSGRVSIIRKRGQYLGTVEAPNEKAAEAAARPGLFVTAAASSSRMPSWRASRVVRGVRRDNLAEASGAA
jgi:hypothetical protein